MTTIAHCSRCQRPLPARAKRPLCAVCLFEAALTDQPANAALLAPGAGVPLAAAGLRQGDYELLAEIARGAMGVVYRARQVRLDRVVALKMILTGQFASEAALSRFRIEAEAAAGLDHPHIVPIYEIGEHEGRPFFSMKFMEGGTLSQMLRRERALIRASKKVSAEHQELFPATFDIPQFVKVVRAVSHAHLRGILHRDLKPGNILFDAQGEPHIVDFGLAKHLDDARLAGPGRPLTLSGTALGTPEYMAPEQVEGHSKTITTAADVYSLGAILYELLTGHPPFQAATPMETMRQVLQDEPKKPSATRVQVDRDLEIICLKCLAKDPNRRYASARLLADDLERWERGEPILARPAQRWEQVLKWTRRHPARAALLGLALLAPAVIIGVLLVAGARITAERNHARAQVKITREQLYALDMALAFQAFQDGNYDQVWRSLAAQEPARSAAVAKPDLRGFEWRWLWQRVQGDSRQTFEAAHQSWVNTIAWSADGQFVVSASADGTTKIWDAVAGKWLHTLVEPDRPSPLPAYTDQAYELAPAFDTSASITADSRRVLTSTAHSLSLWDCASGRLLWCLRTNGFEAAVCSPTDTNFALAPQPQSARLGWLDLAHGTLATVRTNEPATSVCFTPDGHQFARWDRAAMRIWIQRLPTGEVTASLKTTFSDDTSLLVQQMTFTPDGRTLAACDLQDPDIDLFDVAAQQRLGQLAGHAGRGNAIAISPDGRWLASGGTDQTIRLWDLTARREVRQLHGHRAAVCALAFSPDGRRLVSGGYDGTVRFWDLDPPAPVPEITHLCGTFVFSPDGCRLLTQRTNGLAQLWQLPGCRLMQEWATPVFQSALFTTNGQLLTASIGSSNEVPCVRCFTLAPAEGERDGVRGRSDSLKFIGQLPVNTNRTTTFIRRNSQSCSAIALSPDGQLTATGYQDGTVALWETSSGRLLQTAAYALHASVGFSVPRLRAAINPLVFSADSRTLAAVSYEDDKVRTWALPELRPLGDRQFAATGEVPLALAPDGRQLAFGGALAGNSINLWSTDLAQAGTQLRGHQDFLCAVDYSLDGRTLASGGRHGELKLWHLATRREVANLLTLPVGVNFVRIAFSPDGTWLGASDTTGRLHLFHAPPPAYVAADAVDVGR